MGRLGHTGFAFQTRFMNHNDKGKNSIILTLGSGTYIVSAEYEQTFYRNHVLIGSYSSLAHEITFTLALNHPYKDVTTYPFLVSEIINQLDKNSADAILANAVPSQIKIKNPHQIIIGNDVWIGRGATIMGGVKIGSGAVVGAQSVVASDIPPYAIAVGNPARVIKYRFDNETVKKLMAIKWWNWDLKKIYDNVYSFNDIEKFVNTYYKAGMERVPYAKIGGGGRPN